MAEPRTRSIITKVHFYLLGITLVNFLLKNTSEISLAYRLAYIVTLSVYASGIVLFFWNFRPFKALTIYFSVYAITPILALLFWVFGGIFFALLASLVLYPIYPNEIKAETKQVVVYSKYQGFMGSCCPYEITQRKFLLLEEKIALINLNKKIDTKNVSIDARNGKAELKIRCNKYDWGAEKTILTDTLISISME